MVAVVWRNGATIISDLRCGHYFKMKAPQLMAILSILRVLTVAMRVAIGHRAVYQAEKTAKDS
jgi:hypothetical protein